MAVAIMAALVVFQGLVMTRYWGHCAKPALVAVGARTVTLRVVQAIGVVAVLAPTATTVLVASSQEAPDALMILMALATAWYLAAWPRPQFIARISGGLDPLEALRRLVWRLNWTLFGPPRETDRDTWTEQVVACQTQLARFARTPATEQLIELWIAEADAVLSGDAGAAEDNARRGAIAGVAHRLWPDGDAWRVAAPFLIR